MRVYRQFALYHAWGRGKPLLRRVGLCWCLPRILHALPTILTLALALSVIPVVGVAAPVHWADQALSESAIRGIVKGYPDGSVQPDRAVTRAELCTMIIRMLGEEEAAKTGRRLPSSFKDVDENHWGKGYLEVAREKGIFRGDSGDMAAPDRSVTRAEAVTMLDRCLSSLSVPMEEGAGSDFADGQEIPSWARESVKRLAAVGVVVGDPDGRFYPGRSLTRAEAATLTLRVLGLLGRRWDIEGLFRGLSQDNTRLYLETQGQGVSLPVTLTDLEIFGAGGRVPLSSISQGARIGLLLQDGHAALMALLP